METASHSHPIPSAAKKHQGSCHCGAVRFEAEVDLNAGASRCNCSVCMKVAMTGCIVPPGAFRLLSGEDHLSEYVWGGRVSRRYFCKNCGVHCFARGHLEVLGGDYVAVYVNCLDGVDVNALPLQHWDGRHDNWQGGPRSTPWPVQAAPTVPVS